MRHSRVHFGKAAPLFLGMQFSSRHASMDSPEARRVVRVAHERYNLGTHPHLVVAQNIHRKKPSVHRFHITCHSKPGVSGFQCVYKEQPSDTLIVERSLLSTLESSGIVPSTSHRRRSLMSPSSTSWREVVKRLHHHGHQVHASNKNVKSPSQLQLVENQSLQLPQLQESEEQRRSSLGEMHRVVQEMSGKLYTNLRQVMMEDEGESSHRGRQKWNNGSQQMIKKKKKTRRGFVLTNHDDKGDDSLFKIVAGTTTNALLVQAALVPLSSTASDGEEGLSALELWFNGALIAQQLASSQRPEEQQNTSMTVPRVGVCTTTIERQGQPQGSLPLSLSSSLHVTVAGGHLMERMSLLERTLSRNRLHSALTFIGNVAAAIAMESVAAKMATTTTSSSTTMSNPLWHVLYDEAQTFVVIPWINESVSKASHTSGAKLKDESRYGDPKNRSDLKSTSRAEAVRAMQALNDIAQYVLLGNAEGEQQQERRHLLRRSMPWRIAVVGNRTHLMLRVEPTSSSSNSRMLTIDESRRNAAALAVVSPSSSSLQRLNSDGNKRSDLAIQDEAHHSVTFEVVEFILEKSGLSHQFVVQDLLDELKLSSTTTTSSSLYYSPELVASHLGVLDQESHSFQRFRVRGATLSQIRVLSERLQRGDVLEHRSASVALRPEQSLKQARHMQLDWSVSASSCEDEEKTAAGGGRSGKQLSGEVDKDEISFWQSHYYRIHHPTVVWSTTVSMSPTASASTSELKEITVPGNAVVRHQQQQRKHNNVKKKDFIRQCREAEEVSKTFDLQLGDLDDGYFYRVALRHIPDRDQDRVGPAIASLQNYGFVNYFPPHRFSSTCSGKGAHPGLHVLKGEFRAAATLLVDPSVEGFGYVRDREGAQRFLDPKMRRRQREEFDKDNALQSVLRQAIEMSGATLDDETTNASSSSGHHGDEAVFRDVFLNVVGPKAIRMIVNEFLAFVWNDVVSQRIKRFGSHAILEGDLVWKRKHQVHGAAIDSPVAIINDSTTTTVVMERKVAKKKPLDDHREIHVVTQEEIQSGLWTAKDVLLPIPGNNVQLPRNATADIYKATLQLVYGVPYNEERGSWGLFGMSTPTTTTVVGSSGQSTDVCSGDQEDEDDTVVVVTVDETDAADAADERVAQVFSSHEGDQIALSQSASSSSLVRREDLTFHEGNAVNMSFHGNYRPLLWIPNECTWSLKRCLDGPDPLFNRWKQTAAGSERRLLPAGGRYRNSSSLKYELPLEKRPYWLPQRGPASLEVQCVFPQGVALPMMIRELTKFDVNSATALRDFDDAATKDGKKASSWSDLEAHEKAMFQQWLHKKRRSYIYQAPSEVHKALLFQKIFKSGGMRHSILPSPNSRDDVSS